MSHSKHNFNPEIMRAYDIRGKYLKTLFPKDAFFLAKSLSTYASRDNAPLTVCIGRDGRLSSPALHTALLEGFLHSGCQVIDIGIVATPTLYYATLTREANIGVMITGSHNPGDQNGFKMMYKGKSFYGQSIQDIAAIAAEGKYHEGLGAVEFLDVKQTYLHELKERAVKTLPRKLKIAWDPGNGATGELVEMLSEIIPGEHFCINTNIDGNFPNHHPDPTQPENMQQLIATVLKNNCDIGLAFDGDGDRLGAVDAKGRIITGDQLLMILAKDLISRHPGAKIIADVKTSDTIFSNIKELGGEPIMWRTGHSLIKAKMHEQGAMLAGEMSGHLFFGENYYGFDDALFGACKIINILANSDKTFTEMVDQIPQSYSTPELRVDVEESEKFGIVDRLKEQLRVRQTEFNELDGLRVRTDKGWYLVRASNTQNCLVIRVDGNSRTDLMDLSKNVVELFQNIGIDGSHIIRSIE